MMINSICLRECDVKNIRAFEENGRWFLDMTFEREDDRRKEKIHIPKVELDFSNAELVNEVLGKYVKTNVTCIDFYKTRFTLRKDSNDCLYTIESTKKPEKLTLDDMEIDPHKCNACWDREIPENKPVYSTPEEKETSGLSIEIMYSDFSSDVLSGVKYFELIKEARMFKIEHIDSDIYTFVPAEHVIRIGKICEDVD